MISAYELIGQMKDMVNDDFKDSEDFEAVSAYEIRSLPLPVDKIYACFSLDKAGMSYVSVEDELVRKRDTRIRVSCYVPLSKKGYVAERFAETVTSFLIACFSENLAGYSVGGATYESSVRAYKAEAVIEYSYLED